MDRINRIIAHPLWQEHMADIRLLEQTRIFCGHGEEHLLDVARLAYIEDLERDLKIPRDIIYAAALLHDLGRALQYRQGIPHHEAGVTLASMILPDCGFTEEETDRILRAIGSHRCRDTGDQDSLSGILYRADKASRQCLFCQAREQCNWSDEKKNLTLKG